MSTQALATATALLREKYFKDDLTEACRPRRGLPGYFQFKELEVNGDVGQWQVETKPYTGSRFNDLEGALGAASTFTGKKIVVNLGRSTSDLKRITASLEYTWEADKVYDGEGSVVNLVDRLATGAVKDFKERIAQSVWMGSSAKMFDMDGAALAVDGTPLDNADVDFKFAVDSSTGSPTFAIPGLNIDFYDGATLKFGAGGSTLDKVMEITNVEPDPDTMGKWWVYCRAADGTACTSAATLNGLSVYRSGEYGKGAYGLNDWFRVAADGGVDSIFHDEAGNACDRTNAAYRFLLPYSLGNTSLANFTPELFDKVWPVLSRSLGDDGAPNGMILLGDPEMWQTVKRTLEQSANKRTFMPMDSEVSKIFGVDGMNDIYFLDPVIGKVALLGDVHCPANVLRMINPATWGYIKTGTAEFLPGGIEGIWNRVAGYAKYTADLAMLFQIVCFQPQLGNIEMKNVRSVSV